MHIFLCSKTSKSSKSFFLFFKNLSVCRYFITIYHCKVRYLVVYMSSTVTAMSTVGCQVRYLVVNISSTVIAMSVAALSSPLPCYQYVKYSNGHVSCCLSRPLPCCHKDLSLARSKSSQHINLSAIVVKYPCV